MLQDTAAKMLEGKVRLIFPVSIVSLLKLFSSLFIYQRLSIQGSFKTPWMSIWGTLGPTQLWLYLFSAQDTGWYIKLAKEWYSYPPMYVFFPAYPVLCKAVELMTGDFWLSAFIISFVLGLASIPLLQLVAEHYMSRAEAAASTLLTATFPYVFLFTTVSYTESLFLFSTLATWYLHLRGRFISSMLAATVATLTRPYGVAIVIPVALNLLLKRKFKQFPIISVPITALLGWMYYLYLTTGDAFAFATQQSFWIKQAFEFGWFQRYITPFLSSNVLAFPKFDFFLLPFIIFTGYLVFCVFRIDGKLAIYSLSVYLSLLYFGNYNSLPRFFSFIFPVWLIVRMRNLLALAVAVTFFMLASLLIWYQFVLQVWVS